MKNRIILYTLLSFILFSLSQCYVKKANDALMVFNYFKAKKLFEKAEKHNNVSAKYGLAVIYQRHDNPFHNLDSAYHKISQAKVLWQKLDSAKQQKITKKQLVNLQKIDSLKSLIDNKLFQKSLQITSVDSLNVFINKYPDNHFLTDIITYRNQLAFDNAKKENTSAAYKYFLENYPNSSYQTIAENLYQERLFYENTLSGNEQQIARFLKQNPNNKYYKKAERKLYELVTKSGNTEDYLRFILKYPENSFVNDAWQKIYAQEIKSYTTKSLVNFLKKYPDYPFKKEILDEIELLKKQLLPARKNNNWGYVNTKNKVVIPYLYQYADTFSEGLAAVVFNDKYIYINKKGNSPFNQSFDEAYPFKNGLAIVAQKEKYGIIDRSGNFVLPPIYDDIGMFYNNVCIVVHNDKAGIYHNSRKWILPPSYTSIGDFKNSLAYFKQNNKYGILDTLGKTVIPAMYHWIDLSDTTFIRAKNDSLKMGVISLQNKTILPFKFNYVSPLKNKTAIVVKNGKYGYCDNNGKVFIPPQFNFYEYTPNYAFFNPLGFAIVKTKQKFGIIDKTSKKVVPAIFDNLAPFYFAEAIPAEKNKNWGVIDIKSRLLIPYKYNNIKAIRDSALLIVKKDSLYGVVNIKDEKIIDFNFDEITSFETNRLLVKNKGLYGIINLQGDTLIPIKYQSIKRFNNQFIVTEKNNETNYIKLPASRRTKN